MKLEHLMRELDDLCRVRDQKQEELNKANEELNQFTLNNFGLQDGMLLNIQALIKSMARVKNHE